MDQILALCKTIGPNASNPAIVIDLIQRALQEKGLYHYAELHDELQPYYTDALIKPWIKALEIFTYGNWRDYQTTDEPVQLNAAQVLKLKQLTLVSMASKSRLLSFDSISRELDLQETEIGSFIIECIYSGIIEASISSVDRTLEIRSCIGRDVSRERLDEISTLLDRWVDRTSQIIKDRRVEL